MHYGQALRIATEYLAGSMMSRLFAAIIAASLLASAMACAFAQTRPVPGQTPASVIDLNTASRDDLMTLDGIGEVRADAIIRARPFRAKTELVERRLIPEALYDKISDKVMARPPPAAPPGRPPVPTPPKRT